MRKFFAWLVPRRFGTRLSLLVFATSSVPTFLAIWHTYLAGNDNAIIHGILATFITALLAWAIGGYSARTIERIAEQPAPPHSDNDSHSNARFPVPQSRTVSNNVPQAEIETFAASETERLLEATRSKLRKLNQRLKHEVDLRKQLEKKNLDSDRMFHDIIDFLPHAVLVIDTEGKVVAWNRAAEELTGVPASAMLGKGDYEYAIPFYGKRRPVLANAVLDPNLLNQDLYPEVKRRGNTLTAEIFLPTLSPQGKYVAATACPLYDSNGNVVGAIELVKDITEYKLYQEKLKRLAYKDHLTGLPNRLVFGDRLSREIARAHEENRMIAVMFLDIDRLKLINDSLGHTLGDRLIKAVADRLSTTLSEANTVARMGGDEFTILLTGLEEAEQAISVADTVLAELSKPFVVDNREIYLTASIGISLFPEHGTDVETLVRNADAAMYTAKEAGKNTYRMYTPSLHAELVERMMLEHDLRKALENNEFRLHFQPRVDMESGFVVAAEALVRWQHPQLGMLYPSQFIGLADETGLITRLSKWVLSSCGQQLAKWRQELANPIKLSANISAKDIHRSDLVHVVEQVLSETGLDPSYLELELTEETLIQSPEDAARVLCELKDLGVGIAIDDFGTGYSSLGYLRKLPIDVIKIDRSFIKDITTDADDAAIAGAIIAMAHSLRLRVVAEGVETMEQLDFLRKLGCDEIQGYFVAYPVPAEQLVEMLEYDVLFGRRTKLAA
ncbi:MAG: EAL domain-containing protein [Armatimonadota bacterium]|nr:EAL domain-containing protein [Armatimonadota bacterium]